MVYTSSDLPPIRSSVRDFIFPNSRHKNSLRLSSSLQDLSTYNQLDPEQGQVHHRVDHFDQLHFSKPPQKSRKLVILLCFLFFASIIYTSIHLYSNWSKNSTRFFVVLDCGSTGTRVYIYQASINHQKNQNLPILLKSIPDTNSKPNSQTGRAYNRKETEPGLNKLLNNVTGLTHAINPLLTWAEKHIPKHAIKSTSLFLYATAGVRRLPVAESDSLMNNAWLIIKNSSFICKREWVKIISGTEEAFYGWIALNYHTRMLGDKYKKETYGALDLGGSSLQVTFESNNYTNTTLNVTIGQVNHRLSAYSLSGYGLNDAFEKTVIHLLKKNPEKGKETVALTHPCLQTGFKEKFYVGKSKNPVELIGGPNWEECSKIAKLTLNSSDFSNKLTSGNFYAMSGFYVVYRFFNLTPDVPLDDVLQKGREFCEKPWEVAKSSVAAQPFIEQYCFRSPYVVSLLREGLGVRDSQVNIGSGGITWTTGVALLEAGKVIWTRPGFYSYKLFDFEIRPLTIIIILLWSFFLVLCVGNRLKKFRRNVSGNSVLNISSPFSYRRWSPIISGEGRTKTPLSPVARGADVQLADSSIHPPFNNIPHSISSGSLGQMQFYPSPHRTQMRLQSRRSQSREDLISSLSDTHVMKM